MKKFYTLILLAIVAVLNFSANATSITIKTDAASSGKASVYTPSGTLETLTEAGATYNFPTGTYTYVTINANEGYTLTSINTTSGGLNETYTEETSQQTFSIYYFAEGDVVTVTAAEIGSNVGGGDEDDSKTVTFKGEPDTYYVVDNNWNEYWPNSNGETSAIAYEGISTFNVKSYDGSTQIQSVTDQLGNTYGATPALSATVYVSNFEANKMTLTVEMVSAGNDEQDSFDVTVHGSRAFIVKFQEVNRYADCYDYFESETTTSVPFQAGDYFMISSTYEYSTGWPLTKVTVNGVVQNPSFCSTYYYYPTKGDVVEVYTDPEGSSAKPVKFEYTDGTGEDIVSQIFLPGTGYLYQGEWRADDWTVEAGKTIDIYFNSNYSNIAIKVNGEDKDLSTDYNNGNKYYSLAVGSEDSYTITCSGSRIVPYTVTFVTNKPEGLKVYNSQYGSEWDPEITLSGKATEIELAPSNAYLYVAAQRGYKFALKADDDDSEETAPAPNYTYNESTGVFTITGDCEIEVEVEEVPLNTVMVYYEDATWSYVSISYGSVSITPGAGSYTELQLLPGETPNIYAYPSTGNAVLYYNDEKQEKDGYVYTCLTNLKDGDVLKYYTEEKTPLNLTYEISAELNVAVMHDHITPIENPANHTVLPGTMVHIVPMATFADENANALVVKANDEAVEPVDGMYAIPVNADTHISVTKEGSSSVIEIGADANENNDIYNLQGIKVNNANIPAGIYIVNGQKVVIK